MTWQGFTWCYLKVIFDYMIVRYGIFILHDTCVYSIGDGRSHCSRWRFLLRQETLQGGKAPSEGWNHWVLIWSYSIFHCYDSVQTWIVWCVCLLNLIDSVIWFLSFSNCVLYISYIFFVCVCVWLFVHVSLWFLYVYVCIPFFVHEREHVIMTCDIT